MSTAIDVNGDMGESFGVYRYGADDELLPLLTSVNIAAGFHASDPLTLGATVAKAVAHGVRIGAHVGYPDRLGFGRRSIAITGEDAYAYTLYQLGAVDAFVRASGATLSHYKPHGAFYMDACASPAIARPMLQAVKDFDPTLTVYTLQDSAVEEQAAELGLTVWREFFADRPYDGSTVKMFGWTLEEIGSPADAAHRTLTRLADRDAPPIDTVCVHSDTPNAPAILRAVVTALSTHPAFSPLPVTANGEPA